MQNPVYRYQSKKRYTVTADSLGKSEYLQDNWDIKAWTEGPGRTALSQLENLSEFAVDPAGRIVQQGETRHNSAGGRAQSAVYSHWTQAMSTNCVERYCKKPFIPNLLRAPGGYVGHWPVVVDWHHFDEEQDPDPHLSEKFDPDPH